MTTSSTLVTSSTVIFSGNLQLNVWADGIGSWEYQAPLEAESLDASIVEPGVFEFAGTLRQSIDTYSASLAFGPTAPAAIAYVRNLTADEMTLFITMSTEDFDTPIGPVVRYRVGLEGAAANPINGVIDIFDNYIDAYARPGDDYLSCADAEVSEVPGSFSGFDNGQSYVTAEAMHMVWSLTLGPYDQVEIDSSDSVELILGNQARTCVKKMNSGARKVALSASKADLLCFKSEQDATSCVDDETNARQTKTNDRQMANFINSCSIVPDWGVNGGNCCVGGGTTGQACVDASTCNGGQCSRGGCTLYGVTAQTTLMHDIFGATIQSPASPKERACIRAVTRFTGKVSSSRAKEFVGCKTRSFLDVATDAELKSLCLEPQQPDSKGRITKSQEKLILKVGKKCSGDIDLALLFPGDCSAEPAESFGSCLNRLVGCQFCVSTNVVDDISPGVDCDTFDDGLVNTSCP